MRKQPIPMNRRSLALFFSKIEVDYSGCWLWKAALSSSCYPTFAGENAHRVSYRWFVAEIPKPLTVDHICFVPTCVNPAHLQLLTRADNSRRQRRLMPLDALQECKYGHPLPESLRVGNKRGGGIYRFCVLCKRESYKRHDLKRKGRAA